MNFNTWLRVVTALVPFSWGGFLFPCPGREETESMNHGQAAVFVGWISGTHSYRDDRDGLIYTRTTVEVLETLSGVLPGRFSISERGGVVGNEAESTGCLPVFRVGEERLLVLQRDGWQRLRMGIHPREPLIRGVSAMAGGTGCPPECGLAHGLLTGPCGEDLRNELAEGGPGYALGEEIMAPVSGASGLLGSPPRRFIAPDRGEPIPYLVDADALPEGITLDQAMSALAKAVQAWEEVSSVRFRFEGFASFGQPSRDVNQPDGRIRIQMHDLYHAIPGSHTLGIGGQGFFWINPFSAGGTGGRVGPREFHQTNRGYVIINHRAEACRDPVTYEAVLTHEIGHALGLAHSSEDPFEADPLLRQALMYYSIHDDGRGASLGEWDITTVRRVHPPANPPPYGFDRMMRIVTAHAPLAHPMVNQIELRGYDLENQSLGVELSFDTTTNGTFTFSPPYLRYAPSGGFATSAELDPAGNQYYDRVYVRFSDGVNLSPPVVVRVIQYLLDTRPAGAPDGLPDEWMLTHFGNINPVPGYSGPLDDPDGDGLSNLREFLEGTDPLDFNSRPRISHLGPDSLTWRSRPFEVYEVETSEDLIHWESAGYVHAPTGETGVWPEPPLEGKKGFFRVRRVP